MADITSDAIQKALVAIKDPLFDRDIVSLAYVQSVETSGTQATVKLELPTPAHPFKARLTQEVEAAAKAVGATAVKVQVGSKVTSRLTAHPAGGRLAQVKNIIAVAAGKGGVGKSTVATNLALSLARHGASVGLLDADVYGPSVPTMLGDPDTPASQSGQRIVPAVHYGVQVMSVGFFVDRAGAVVWRGPMVHKLLQQFVEDVAWAELDYLVVDLPPGTGDAQLSLSQLIPITGSVIVTTPQEIALIDVVKAVNMFQKVEIPVLGVVENMSYYKCPACGHTDEIFARGGGRRLAADLKVNFLGEVPIDSKVRHGGDSGRPVVVGAPDSEHARIFMDMAATVAGEIAKRNGPGGGTGKRAAGLVSIR